jgi:hypothetical protein
VDSVTVLWETTGDADGAVVLAETERVHTRNTSLRSPLGPSAHDGLVVGGRHASSAGSEERTVTEPGRRRSHRVTVSGLQPDTDYNYYVRSSDGSATIESSWSPCGTARPAGTPFAFSVCSELGGSFPMHQASIFTQIGRHRPDFLVLVGDVVSEGTTTSDWSRELLDPGRELFARTPFYLVPGK